jgi:hypothetical protein
MEEIADCERLEKCPFFNYSDESPDVAAAKRGLSRQYCQGKKRKHCVRLAIFGEFPQDVPQNMMPNGLPMPGTSDEGWNPEVVAFKQKLFLECMTR